MLKVRHEKLHLRWSAYNWAKEVHDQLTSNSSYIECFELFVLVLHSCSFQHFAKKINDDIQGTKAPKT